MSDSPTADEAPTPATRHGQVDEEWLERELAKAPRKLTREQARIARRLRTRHVTPDQTERRRPA